MELSELESEVLVAGGFLLVTGVYGDANIHNFGVDPASGRIN